MATPRLSLGQLIHTRHFIREGEDVDLDPLWRAAAAAEAAGLDEVWLGDSVCVPNKGRTDCLTTMAALAMATRTIGIGTVPLLASLRQPVLLAQALATVDVISKGRLVVGVSAGPIADDIGQQFEACGVPRGEKAGRLNETLALLRRLWTEPAIDHDGKYFRLRNTGILPKPFRKPSIPLFVAADRSEAGWRRVARYGDGWITNLNSTADFATARRTIFAHAAEYGRPESVTRSLIYATFNLDPDGDAARRDGWAWMESHFGAPAARLSHHTTFLGTPGEVKDTIAAYVDQGLTGIIARFAADDQDTQRRRFVEAFGAL